MNQQNQHEHCYELGGQRLIMFVYQLLLDTKDKIIYFRTKLSFKILTSFSDFSSGLAVYELDEPVKTSSINGFSGSVEILNKKLRLLFFAYQAYQ